MSSLPYSPNDYRTVCKMKPYKPNKKTEVIISIYLELGKSILKTEWSSSEEKHFKFGSLDCMSSLCQKISKI